MSQVIKNLASGPVPPTVPTSFLAQTNGVNNGTAVPSANVLTVNGINGAAIAGSGSTLTVSVVDGGFIWTDKSTSFLAASGNGYFVIGTATASLPASPSNGDTIKFILDDPTNTSTLTIQASSGQFIRIGNTASTSGGIAQSSIIGSSITIVWRPSANSWLAESNNGTWTFA